PAQAATVSGATVKRAKSRRLTLAFSLDAPSSLKVAVERAATGRRAGKACVKATRSNRRKASCTRWVRTGGVLTVAGVAGTNRPALTLPSKAGRYRVSVTPAGGKATAVTFRVPAKRR
ncbi:MAG TPA: hypothetical protein VN238_13120, partial [Solirubrobacteraceae bacterium]|nr:hypothetical protein [Solirubrobacteraceae bacterium]